MNIKRHNIRDDREKTLQNSIVEGVTEHLATMTYTPENLLLHVAIKLNQIEPILKKSKTRFGRFINRFNGESADYVTIDGMVLIQLHEILGEAPTMPLVARYQYDIAPNELKAFYIRAKEIVQIPSVKRRR